MAGVGVILSRRRLITAGLALAAAPMIVRAASIMRVRGVPVGDGVALTFIDHPAAMIRLRPPPVGMRYADAMLQELWLRQAAELRDGLPVRWAT